MITSKWSDAQANEYVERYARRCNADVALRTYTAHLLGREKTLVLHGGGNTSVKSKVQNILGDSCQAIFVKGSGWDLASIEPEGHPGLDLAYLRKLRAVTSMSDEVMVNELRTHLFSAQAPTPSVETLLHAFLPAKFIDHSHANEILTLSDTPAGEDLLRECFADQVGYVPYVMPGFELAKRAADVFDANPKVQGLILLKHGLFSFGATARESYEKHVDLVNQAEAFWRARLKKATVTYVDVAALQPAQVLPILRGALATRDGAGNPQKRFVLDLRSNRDILTSLSRIDIDALLLNAPLTPDHVIRTKAQPMLLRLGADASEAQQRQVILDAIANFDAKYRSYFEQSCKERNTQRTMLDTRPRIVLIPGLGIVGLGEDRNAARIAADIFEHTLAVKLNIASFSSFEGLAALDLFDVEYWSLEQAKLAMQKPRPLQGRVAVITGACGAIGIGVAQVLKQAGAEVVLTDVQRVSEVSRELSVAGYEMDVTSQESVRGTFAKIVQEFGGIDIVIPNAGVAHSAPLERISEEVARRVIDVNFHGYLNTLKVSAEILKRQATGGSIIIISSKNVLAPGKEFSIYSASKAAGHQLGKVAALELAPYAVRVNMVAPDAVFGSEKHPSGLWQDVGPARARARGMELKDLEGFYQERNLLKRRISAEDVGRAVLFFATEQTPTTGATLAVDGGIAEAFVR